MIYMCLEKFTLEG
jgi:hypothetical protein